MTNSIVGADGNAISDARVIVVAELSGRQLMGVYDGPDGEIQPGNIALLDPVQFGEPRPGQIVFAPITGSQTIETIVVTASSVWEVSPKSKLHEKYFEAVSDMEQQIRAANSGLQLARPGDLGGVRS